MYARTHFRGFECVGVDLNTQRDFCEPDRAFPVSNIQELIPALRRVIAWIKRNQIPTVSSIESHREWELSDSGNPIHCVDGSNGQEKLDFTILDNRTYVPSDNTLAVPIDLFNRYQQVIFCKRTDDLLGNPKADRLMTQVSTREFILFGVGIETSIKALALALLARGKRVTIVADACGYWSRCTADLAIRQIVAKGGDTITLDELSARKLDRTVRYGSAPGQVRFGPRMRLVPISGSSRPANRRPPNGHSGNGHLNLTAPTNGHGKIGLPIFIPEAKIAQENGDQRTNGQ